MKNSDRSSGTLFTIGIAALFLAGFFLLVVFGARSYRDTVAVQNGNMEDRALLSYLTVTLKANDVRGAVTVADSEGGQVLTIAQGDTGYALRIYCHDGRLLEEFDRADTPLKPENAQDIAGTETFTVEELSDGLLRITTDAGGVLLRLRSEGGGAA